jgi:hypothetical protein
MVFSNVLKKDYLKIKFVQVTVGRRVPAGFYLIISGLVFYAQITDEDLFAKNDPIRTFDGNWPNPFPYKRNAENATEHDRRHDILNGFWSESVRF